MTTAPQHAAAPAPETNVGKGVFLLLTAMLIFGVQDALSKILVETYSPFQIVMIRYWAFTAMSLWLVMRRGSITRAFQSRAPGWQLARGLLLFADIWLYTEALKTVPLGDIGAIIMIYPLLVTVFAIPFLGEKVGLFRMAAVVAGFVGTLIIVRPGFASVEIGTILALLSAATYALYLVFTRKVSHQDSTTTSIFYVAVVGLVLSTGSGLFFWQDMTLNDTLLVVVVCITMCSAHGLVMVAMRFAPASVLQPFNYFSLPWAITLGYLVFGTLIDGFALFGARIIVVAGLVVMWRERQLRIRRPLSSGRR